MKLIQQKGGTEVLLTGNTTSPGREFNLVESRGHADKRNTHAFIMHSILPVAAVLKTCKPKKKKPKW